MATSSANIFIGEDTVDGKSLIYRMKSRGPKIEPCGIPDWTGDHSDEHDNYSLRMPPGSKKRGNHYSSHEHQKLPISIEDAGGAQS